MLAPSKVVNIVAESALLPVRHRVKKGSCQDDKAARPPELTIIYSFGEWIKQRHMNLRFTQGAIAEQVFCFIA
jgi:hypothetical protein